MKILALFLASALMFSCQKGSESSNSNGIGAPDSGGQQQGSPARKILKIQEILAQDISAKEQINWGSAESFPVTDENEKDKVKLSYFFQENNLIKSKDIEKSKGYCELSRIASENVNGSEIVLTESIKLRRFLEYRSEKTQINNLNYKYDAMFTFLYQSPSAPSIADNARPIELSCYNVLDLTELKATIDSKFIFTEREDKKEEK